MTKGQSYDLGPYFCANQHHDLLHQVLGYFPLIHGADGLALEFGVGDGSSLRCISRHLPVIGFDSFRGLPEDWRPGFEEGSFAYDFDEVLENTPDSCALTPGLFSDTLPKFPWHNLQKPIQLVHVDCDLYSSTMDVLSNLPFEDMIEAQTVIVFDEWYGYPGCEKHEQRAWKNFAAKTGIEWTVIGSGHQAWGIQL